MKSMSELMARLIEDREAAEMRLVDFLFLVCAVENSFCRFGGRNEQDEDGTWGIKAFINVYSYPEAGRRTGKFHVCSPP